MTGEQKPLEILVIDDDKKIRDLLVDILQGPGVNVVAATDGEEGIGEYTKKLGTDILYNVVFTDLNMPKKDGVDVLEQVKKLSPETLVYIITGIETNGQYDQLSDKLAKSELKPDGTIKKPFNVAEINNLIGSIKLYLQGAVKKVPTYQSSTPQS